MDGHPPPGPNDNNSASRDRVTAGYFEVIGNPILRGRGISERDTATSLHVAVINEAFARKFFKNEDPIGKHFGRFGVGSEHQYEIVGIAKDARYLSFDFDKPVAPFFFQPETQHDIDPKTGLAAIDRSHFLQDIVIVTRPGVRLPIAQIRRAMASVDPSLPIISIHTLQEQVAGQFKQQRLIARLTSLFGILSLVLASIGLYGVTAYNAGCRTNEIGVRMALGADRRACSGVDTTRRVRTDSLRAIDWIAIDLRSGAIPGQSALRHESIQSHCDVRSRRNARVVSAGCFSDSCITS